jgi:hypothetical protein
LVEKKKAAKEVESEESFSTQFWAMLVLPIPACPFIQTRGRGGLLATRLGIAQ